MRIVAPALVAVLVLPWTALFAAVGSDSPHVIKTRVADGVLEWRFRDRPLLTYAFHTNQFKPYVRELFSLSGTNLLLDGPLDHPHHHGLMFALHANGVNFWEENEHSGRQHHVGWAAQTTGRDRQGHPWSEFTEVIRWLPPGTGNDSERRTLLLERRTLRLTVDEARNEVALQWSSDLEIGAATNHIQLHGTDYNGLGMRLPAHWNRVAVHQNSERKPYPTAGRRDVVSARWASVSLPQTNPSPLVILCARPTKHATNAAFFSMTQPFTYLAATLGLDRHPQSIRAGTRLRLDYLLLVCTTAPAPAEISQRHRLWAEERRPGRD